METQQQRELNREQNQEQQYSAEQGQQQYSAGQREQQHGTDQGQQPYGTEQGRSQTNVDQAQEYRGNDGQMGRRQEFEPVGQRQQAQTMEQPNTLAGGGGLMGGQQMERYASQWSGIQAAFVDEPRKAVEQADQLVAQIIQDLSRTFASERQKLEGQWSRGDQVSTEDLRVALQRYRQFFQSLLRT